MAYADIIRAHGPDNYSRGEDPDSVVGRVDMASQIEKDEPIPLQGGNSPTRGSGGPQPSLLQRVGGALSDGYDAIGGARGILSGVSRIAQAGSVANQIGRGNPEGAAALSKMYSDRQQRGRSDQRRQAAAQQLKEMLPNGIQTPQDMQTAMMIFTQTGGVAPEKALEVLMANYQAGEANKATASAGLRGKQIEMAKYLTARYDKIGGVVYENVMENFTRIHDSYTAYEEAMLGDGKIDPNSLAYQTLAVGIQKMLDPDSVVRGSEYDRSAQFQG